ncbi:hypothetical protein QQM39_39395 [Streptomyces sp. DT2A-34]|uniref:hypothetical protein n=1 Tax=Streptomyces sp. DT2A-34 TaxID=3051182 RepID=UPI00265BC29C|nr:hypothetical protein [Streptomyces sp. DT2A-34]MDO0916668.1 hypothetical protein [Streptomyces sp. DT2A-34]
MGLLSPRLPSPKQLSERRGNKAAVRFQQSEVMLGGHAGGWVAEAARRHRKGELARGCWRHWAK